MFLILTALYAFQRTLAAPIAGNAIAERPPASTCTDLRSLWNIVWSCIVTLFACTWLSVHPNIPTPKENAQRRWYSRPLRRAHIMLYALIGPEFVVFWAWRERKIASTIPVTLPGWSRVHGFFALMGGFVDGEKVLSLRKLKELVEGNAIEYPIVNREEIQDRSKGDAITKALVVAQTTWFLLQCAVRASQHLAVTELELATSAYAVLNIIIYVLWWDKPLDVQCPIKVRRNAPRDPTPHPGDFETDQDQRNEDRNIWEYIAELDWSLGRIWSSIGKLIFIVIRPFTEMMGSPFQGSEGRFDHRSMFLRWGLGAVLTAAFGGIHCVGWSFDFPSPTERILWLFSSAVITGIPFAYVGLLIGVHAGSTFWFSNFYFDSFRYIHAILYLPYVISRVLLLVLLVSTLRSLPPSAFQTVKWTTFIPHV